MKAGYMSIGMLKYGNLFLAHVSSKGDATVIRLKYGD
jgi:hypothetical protein